jgi:tartrate-resistant acid phosphatase type 5
MTHSTNTTRRRFLRETFAFSALALTGASRSSFAAPTIDPAGNHLLMIGDWGASGKSKQQALVAAAMRTFVDSNKLKTDALLMLGDNFYGQFDGGVEGPRWKTQFEEMYPASTFHCPAYAVLGNHDYHVEPAEKPNVQLAYAKQGGRWTMPAKWYRFDFPDVNPLVTFIALDSNYQTPTSAKQALTEQERVEQAAWLKAELAKPRQTRFLVVFGHHPLYSNGDHGDSSTLIKLWDPIFREHKVHLYLCGHDHDMQHLEFASHPTSFVISGGGGAGLRELTISPDQRGPFGRKVAGFSHLQVTPDRLILRHIDAEGGVLHAFSKSADGTVEKI